MPALDDVRAALSDYAADILRRAENALTACVQGARSRAEADAPVRTGALRRSIDTVRYQGRADVVVRAPYALYAETRVRPFLSQALVGAREDFIRHFE